MDGTVKFDSRRFREVLGQYPTGVSVVTGIASDGQMAGLVVGSFSSVSLDPPLVSLYVDQGSSSWPRIQQSGKFCVNVLGSDQEDVCRQFASRGGNKFEGLNIKWSPLGSPIVEGAVAWVDCEIERIHQVGDHIVVYGRVHDLDIASSSLPLLFFQGGYGGFSPLSMVATRGVRVSAERLRQVDLIRGQMEELADQLEAKCIATAVSGDAVVVLASAGSPASTGSGPLVGGELPFVPPTGGALVAWEHPQTIDRWLKDLPGEGDPALHRERLQRVRERGFSIGLLSEAQREFASALDLLAEDPSAVGRGSLRSVATRLDYDPKNLSQEELKRARVILVPVFDKDERAVLALSVYGFGDPSGQGGVGALIDKARAASLRGTELLGGKVPSVIHDNEWCVSGACS